MGDGLSLPLDSFRVTLLPGDPARFVHLGNDPHAANEWSLHNLDLVPGYAAALAYCGAPRKLRLHLLGDSGAGIDEAIEDSLAVTPATLEVAPAVRQALPSWFDATSKYTSKAVYPEAQILTLYSAAGSMFTGLR